jgi:hypothetical protein
MQVPTDEQFFSREDPSKPDIAFLKNHFYREGRLTEDQALYILQKGTEIIRAEPNLLELNAPITGTSSRMLSHDQPCTHPRPPSSMRGYSWAIRESEHALCFPVPYA